MATIYNVTPKAIDAILPESVIGKAVRLGHYQIAVLNGNQAWSGADLAGNARSYGARYAEARRNALEKVRKIVRPHGVDIVVQSGKHNKLSLCWTVAGIPLPQWVAAQDRPGLAGCVGFGE